MARKKSGKRSKRGSKSSARPTFRLPNLSRASVMLGLTILAWLALAGAVAYAWTWGVPRLRDRYTTANRPDRVEVVLVNAPAWVRKDIEEEICGLAAAQLDPDPLDRDGLVLAREAVTMSGWYAHVDRLVRSAPGRVEIHGRLREPFAVIRDAEGHHLVDREGRLLPRHYPAHLAPASLPIVEGPRHARPPGNGEIWRGPDVAAGLDLAALVRDEPWFPMIATIDVSSFASSEVLWMTTTTGGRILWGRRPGREAGLEVPARQKLHYLDFMHHEYDSLDRGMSEIDITGDKVTAR